MNRIALTTFSYFDSGNRPSGSEPERFYHGFVLGLMVELVDRYVITSNRESGYGKYDVMLKPLRIATMNYKTILIAEGISENRIRSYGLGFEEKRILIG